MFSHNRQHYSERYADDTHEYRHVILPKVSASYPLDQLSCPL